MFVLLNIPDDEVAKEIVEALSEYVAFAENKAPTTTKSKLEQILKKKSKKVPKVEKPFASKDVKGESVVQIPGGSTIYVDGYTESNCGSPITGGK